MVLMLVVLPLLELVTVVLLSNHPATGVPLLKHQRLAALLLLLHPPLPTEALTAPLAPRATPLVFVTMVPSPMLCDRSASPSTICALTAMVLSPPAPRLLLLIHLLPLHLRRRLTLLLPPHLVFARAMARFRMLSVARVFSAPRTILS